MARPHRRFMSWLLVGLAFAVVCGVAVARRGEADPILRTVTVGSDPIYTLTLDDRRDRAFVFNRQDGTLDTLDTRTGALLRTVTLTSGNVWLAVAERAGRVVVSGFEAGTITTLDVRTGALVRTVGTAAKDLEAAVDERTNHVFVGSMSDVTMLDARSGAVLRHLDPCAEPFAVAVSVHTGHVFVKCDDGTIAMLDARSGRRLRLVSDQSGQYGYIVVDERTDRVFAGFGNTPRVDVLDARTGAYLRGIAIDPAVPPVVDERTGYVYIPLSDFPITAAEAATPPRHRSEIAVLDGYSGAVLRRIPVAANPLGIAVDARTGRVLVVSAGAVDVASRLPTGNGTLSVLDSGRGRVLRTVQVGVSPSDVVVDTRTQRTLVVNSYADVYAHGALKAWRPREGWWPRALRRIKQVICCLPFQAPAPPAPTTNGTVTTFDLSRL